MQTESFIPGKDASLESTIRTMQAKLATRGFVLNESSWLNEIESIWSVHVKDQECPMLFANGKPGEWNASESGHPGIYDEKGKTLLFFQGNSDKGKTWYLSHREIRWTKEGTPELTESPGALPH